MIQADESLLVRARKMAEERGVTFPLLVRDALEHEIGGTTAQPLSGAGTIDSGGAARRRQHQPDAWR